VTSFTFAQNIPRHNGGICAAVMSSCTGMSQSRLFVASFKTAKGIFKCNGGLCNIIGRSKSRWADSDRA